MSTIINLLCNTVLSFLFALLNIGLVAVILSRRRNRERQEFLFIAGMALGDIIYSIGFFLSNCRRLEYFSITIEVDVLILRNECVLTSAPILLFWGNTLVGNMSLMNSIDRFLATFLPIWYYHRKTNYTLALLSISFIGATFFLTSDIAMVLLSKAAYEKVNIYCGIYEFSHPIARRFFLYFQYACIVISALLYIAIGISIHKRLKKGNHITIISQQNSKKLLKSNTTMALIMLNTVIFLLIPEIIIDMNIGSADFKSALYLLILIKTGFNFLIFVSRHHDLRSFIVGSGKASTG